jgi:hypothetical protein
MRPDHRIAPIVGKDLHGIEVLSQQFPVGQKVIIDQDQLAAMYQHPTRIVCEAGHKGDGICVILMKRRVAQYHIKGRDLG